MVVGERTEMRQDKVGESFWWWTCIVYFMYITTVLVLLLKQKINIKDRRDGTGFRVFVLHVRAQLDLRNYIWLFPKYT